MNQATCQFTKMFYHCCYRREKLKMRKRSQTIAEEICSLRTPPPSSGGGNVSSVQIPSSPRLETSTLGRKKGGTVRGSSTNQVDNVQTSSLSRLELRKYQASRAASEAKNNP